MNRFRSRKKSHDAGDPHKAADEAPAVPSLPSSFASKTFKRNKKAPQEVKAQVNIATALPSSDDFRTSLLMPNLSARFSMLREQDDPNSKIGKANDDSVLFPKRASRLNLFSRNELMDIAEVDSSRNSRRPTLKAWGTDSYASFDSEEDGSHGGSVMSRARPGEGNTMFGGRQKIYKIPVGGTGTSKNGNEDGDGASSKGMGGKVLYGDDVSLSAFQKLREREREQEIEEQERATIAQQNSPRSSKENVRSNSPQQVSYNHHRETASSTASALSELRSSTAATSVASQKSLPGGHGLLNGNSSGMAATVPATAQAPISGTNIDRSIFKSRRLYGQGLDQQLHEQQSSAVSRLETLHRQRTVGSLPLPNNNLTLSRSATNLNERFQRSSPLYASHEFRAGSPPPSATPSRFADLELGPSGDQSKPTNNRMRADSGFRRTPPLSPPISPIQDPTLVAALEPNDLGKATASGAFNKPRKQYDDEQYLQRQLQLHHGRETRAPSLDEHPANRTRDNSVTSTQSRPISLKNHQDQHSNDPVLAIVPENPGPYADDPQSGTNQPRSIGGSSHNVSPVGSSPQPRLQSGQHTPPSPVSRQTSNGGLRATTNPERPAHMDHPMYRTNPTDYLHTPPPDFQPPVAPQNNLQETSSTRNDANDVGKPNGFDADSPTLSPTSGLNGLDGIVSSHVRNESESSVYPDESPALTSKFHLESYHQGNPLGIEHDTRRSETFSHKKAWDPGYRDSGHDGLPRPDTAERKEAMPEPLAIKAHQIFSNASALQKLEAARTREEKAQNAMAEAHRTSDESSSSGSWREQLRAHGHTRGASTETAKEQENFANELAERRRMVRDNLQSFVENESRSASPHATARILENSPSKPGAPFGMLKSKSSKSSLSGRKEQPSKAMKMLGISSVPNNLSGSPRSAHDSAIGDESDMYHPGHDRKVNGRLIAPGFQSPNYFQPQRRDPYNPSQERLPQRSSPPSSKGSAEVRSNLGSPERPPGSPHDRSNGRGAHPVDRGNGYHQEGPKYRAYSQSPRIAPELAENLPGHQIPPSSPHPALSGRSRGNSRTGSATGYYDHRRGNLAVQTNSPQNLVPSGPPSSAPSARSASSAQDVSPSLPSSSTPVMITSPPPQVTAGRVQQHRKRSINKQDISDPMFISSTSSVGTVALPPGASLSNGMEKSHGGPAPPVPPFNPRRKRNLILRQALGRGDKAELSPSRELAYHERSNASADETEQVPRPRQRLRKISSEGGSMNTRARQQVLLAPSPALPHFPEHSVAVAPSSSVVPFTTHPGLQQYPNEQVVPAPAVMF